MKPIEETTSQTGFSDQESRQKTGPPNIEADGREAMGPGPGKDSTRTRAKKG